VIFVTVGTNEARFDRLLQAVANLPPEEDVVVQHGHSARIHPPGAAVVDFMPFHAAVETIRAARVVVTHAGVGSIMIAVANGKRPIVVPRLRAFAEAVDDHQLQLGRRFARAGLVTLVETPELLGDALGQAQQATVDVLPASSDLAAELRSFVELSLESASLPARL
jgi:UDP-N-acetylglucosamine transferase subunit ALG13